MIGFIKRLFSQPDAESAPATPKPTPSTPQPAPAPRAAAAPPAPVAAPAPAPAPSSGALRIEGETLLVPFSDIVPRLPNAMAPRHTASLAGAYPLPIKNAVAQLPTGAVRVRYVELRHAAVPGTFPEDPNLDESLVELPLQKILAALGPSAITRRQGQAQIEVPEEVVGLFGPKGQTSARVVSSKTTPASAMAAAAAPAAPAAPPSRPAGPTPPTPAPTPPTPAKPAPVPAAANPVISPLVPGTPKPVISPIAPSAPAPVISPVAPGPAPALKPVISPISPGPVISPIAPGPVAAPVAARRPAPVPAPSAPTPIAPVAPAVASAAIAAASSAVTVMLSALYEFWPDSVRHDITQANWSSASVTLPMDRLESAMKAGRVVFKWSEVVQWLDVPSRSSISASGETSLELPLKVIAPLFMSKRTTGEVPRRKVTVGENIPDLFAGVNKPSASAAVAVEPAPIEAPVPAPTAPMFTPAPTPVAAPVVTPVAAPVAAPVAVPGPPNVLGQIFGKLVKRDWTPPEIAAGINELPGVLGSLITMSDGFLVAGELPAPFKPETMAAFLPQMFGRLAHYSGEIQLGTLNSLTLSAGKSRCMVFKAGTVYLAVVGKPGEELPEAQLQRVAGELAERNQQ